MFNYCPVAEIRCLTCDTRCAFIVLLGFFVVFILPFFVLYCRSNDTCRSGVTTSLPTAKIISCYCRFKQSSFLLFHFAEISLTNTPKLCMEAQSWQIK